MFETAYSCDGCNGATAMLFLLLVIGTPLIALQLRSVRLTFLFSRRIRVLISDSSLFLGVILSSCFGSFVFRAIPLEPFRVAVNPRFFQLVNLSDVPLWSVFACAGFGFILAVLLIVDHLISSAMAQTPSMLLKKGEAFHWDLFLTGCICVVSSLFGLPWINASIPQSPMHTLSLADVEELQTSDGHTRLHVTYARETRVAIFFANVLIGISIFALPMPLQLIPVPVLYGVFLFLSVSSLEGNSFWERLVLFVTEQNRYPLRSYLEKVPQRWVHGYTATQLVFLGAMCSIAFVPQAFVNLMFPLFLLALVLVRRLLLPRIFPADYIEFLDRPP